MERVAAIGALIRNAELALHQAVYTARIRDRRYPPSWRALASAAGVPHATLNRRYRRRPARTAPEPVAVESDEEVEQLMSAEWEPDEEPDWHREFDRSLWD